MRELKPADSSSSGSRNENTSKQQRVGENLPSYPQRKIQVSNHSPKNLHIRSQKSDSEIIIFSLIRLFENHILQQKHVKNILTAEG